MDIAIKMTVQVTGTFCPWDFTINVPLKPGDDINEKISKQINELYDDMCKNPEKYDCEVCKNGSDFSNWGNRIIIPDQIEILEINKI